MIRADTLRCAAKGATCAVALALAGGCKLPGAATDSPQSSQQSEQSPLRSADNAFTSADRGASVGRAAELPTERRNMLTLAVLHVEIPARELDAADNIWTHINESQIDADVGLRLSRNGLRVGVADLTAFEPIRVILDSIPRHRVTQPPPLSVPNGLPLVLEMDAEPRDQTIFCVAADGILSGGTYLQSRNSIRVTYGALPGESGRIRFYATPEIQQREDGFRWIRTEMGLWQQPNERRFVVEAASFGLELKKGEMVIIAPSRAGRAAGLVGETLLARDFEGERYYSFVFMRPEVSDVGQSE
ncbi:MAG: hypothetical protein ACKVS9_07420 [Phycisphaerae bacterium]